MDAHVFRIIGREALLLLHGARLEKIHSPFPDVTVFLCYKEGSKFRLVARCGKTHPALFLTARPLPNPSTPPAYVMRLRKYAGGLRLGMGTMDFTRRVLDLPILKEGKEQPFRLVLDLKNGPSVTGEARDGEPPVWPGEDVIRQLCAEGGNTPGVTDSAPPTDFADSPDRTDPLNPITSATPAQSMAQEAWRAYPLLTPPLRETLAALSFPDAMALMVDLEAGGGGLFFYADPEGKPVRYCAWPLPESMLRKRNIREMPEASRPDDGGASDVAPGFASAPCLAATSVVDENRLLEDFSHALKTTEHLPQKKQDKRIKKTLAKLDQEEKRLRGMSGLHEDARRIQERLWQFTADYRAASVTVTNEEGEEREIALDPRLTLRENMARMFHQAARGQRGLSMLAERRRQLTAMPEAGAPSYAADSSIRGAKAFRAATPGSPARNSGGNSGKSSAGTPGGATGGGGPVARFVSQDGYVMLRGKNAKGNQAAIKMGQPYDYWLHAQDGPSAHLVIRRAHAADEVPESTLLEAAALVAEKSRYRDEGGADIMVCLLRHVHAIKGASPGTVRVDKILMHLHTTKTPEFP